MTPEQRLAGLQGEVRGLSETVQRLAPENETQESVDGWSRQDSDDGERSCKADQADSLQRS